MNNVTVPNSENNEFSLTYVQTLFIILASLAVFLIFIVLLIIYCEKLDALRRKAKREANRKKVYPNELI